MERTSRKREHIQYAIETGISGKHGFEDVKFVHNCIPESSMADVSLSTSIGGLDLSSPILINAMTGGTGETYEINRRLALLAEGAGLAMAVGSQMAAIKEPSVQSSFSVVREVNPNGIIFANLGAEATTEQALRAVDMIQADGLQIHLNVMQELIMPEGDRDFRGVCKRIEDIVKIVHCPVFVKEVGFGMSKNAAQRLVDLGIQAIDIGGAGGTNFAEIENRRRMIPLEMLNDWGLTTVQSLLELSSITKVDKVATGGITNGLEIVKALALGATSVGMAGFFLRLVKDFDLEEGLSVVSRIHEQVRLIMTALGVSNIYTISDVPVVISGDSYHWAAMRGIDCTHFSQRNEK
ncbi:type 2 isopentenyl-diphosphate Delta-isomerase [Ammoniphilus resinae]|uniref:Isopentenyl-diphosphate delta-isomerase n=1 Tax=Ammoniphilus resinae TaxID=861532 RepID=A0ABS4GUB8_9BACL|nr:type 2 isopentenyl-diphosphate Delta-isomerase [Ammoniphilus resinae]MBP1933475.1 isopentenyl-diphosphate delta-isomerase [Ammoniphilus resinae]